VGDLVEPPAGPLEELVNPLGGQGMRSGHGRGVLCEALAPQSG
jgi:hypothetical protein